MNLKDEIVKRVKEKPHFYTWRTLKKELGDSVSVADYEATLQEIPELKYDEQGKLYLLEDLVYTKSQKKGNAKHSEKLVKASSQEMQDTEHDVAPAES